MAESEAVLRTNIVAGVVAEATDVADVPRWVQALRDDGTFADIDYADATIGGWLAFAHVTQLRTLAVAATRTSALGDAAGRVYLHWVLRTPPYLNPNWWFNEIGVPLALSEAMLVLQQADALPAEGFDAATAIIDRAGPSQTSMTATNLMWLATATRNAGVLRALQPSAGDAQRAAARDAVHAAYANIGRTFVVTTGDGIQPDGSFHAHGPMLYDGGYGLSWVADAGRVLRQAAGSGFGVSADATRVLIDYLLDGPRWMFRGNVIDPLVTGREISRPTDTRRAAAYDDAIVQAHAYGNGYRADEVAAWIAASASNADDIAPPPGPAGHRQFFRSDYAVHRTPQADVLVKLVSTRTATPENINGENLLALHQYNGVHLTRRRGDEYTGLAPMWDWARLPGTTTDRGVASLVPPPPAKPMPRGETDFAGGATDGTDGIVGYAQHHAGVSARKTWAMLGRITVVLIAAIDAPAAVGRVGTCVNQCRLRGDVTLADASGIRAMAADAEETPAGLRWVHHDGVGYVFFEPTDRATIRTVVRAGRWSAVSHVQSDTPVQTAVFDLDTDHGVTPSIAPLAYAIVVGVTASETAAFADAPSVCVLRNDGAIQAVCDADARVVVATFFEPADLEAGDMRLTSRTPGRGVCVLLRTVDDTVRLTVASPQHFDGEFALDVRRRPNAAAVRVALPGGVSAGSSVRARVVSGHEEV